MEIEKTCHITEQLLRDIEAGSHDAFSTFYDITYPVVYRFTHYFLSCDDDCEEVVSEVFYIIWKRKNILLTIKNIKAWLYIVCRNEAYHYLKQKEQYANISIDNMPVGLQIDTTSIEEQIIEDEMLHVYNNAVSDLPERCKLVFLMVREEKLKYREIAEILSITEGTVEQQMNIAIRKIVDVVEKHYPSLNCKRPKNRFLPYTIGKTKNGIL
ncbi:MAG: sigma-70 family RNA polymerase sigma factor [Tannerellaceae bacterium]|jgi:RNA polymerase sigma-70 factor (ECF subfamily)|nr:sigma-70 family RNA polymerase sigma factor [Tannerellaceae bacterium]